MSVSADIAFMSALFGFKSRGADGEFDGILVRGSTVCLGKKQTS
jgi:hypothetical protein